MGYAEKRVRVADFGILPLSSDLLVSVPSVPGMDCKVHVLAASDLLAMAAEIKRLLGIEALIASGCRAHRWASRAAYEAAMVTQYGSVAEGQRWVAFNSPHETGLAVDFGCGGLHPDSKTAIYQRQTLLWAWLHDNAWRFGFTPYLPEPWHWEHWIPREAWLTGAMPATTEATATKEEAAT